MDINLVLEIIILTTAVEKIKEIGAYFDLHPLLLEDVLNTGQRPKVEEFENCMYFVLKMLRFDEEKQLIIAEQLSIVIGKAFLLTFQEKGKKN